MSGVEIYALCHPDTGEIRYIGKANCAQKRLKRHILDARRRDTPVYRWFRKLAAEGKVPTVTVLHVCDGGPWQSVEIKAIADARASGCRLLNVAEGGDEPHCSVETRKRGAATMNLKRPKNIMRLYRIMESSIRSLDRFGIDTKELRWKFGFIKDIVAKNRMAGTLDILDQKFGSIVDRHEGSAR